jgi:outer membrane protein
MKKPMMVAVVSAGALIGVLYNLPKVIVNDKKGLGIEAAKPSPDSVSHLSTDHTVSLTPTQQADINRLRNNFLTETNKEKKLKFADSLAVMFTQVSKPDSAASYWEEIARQEPTLANLLKAGNGYYDAFGFTVDTERANQLEAKSKMAMTYITTANPMQGIMLLREVIATDPKNELALFNLGLLSIRSGQYDKAIERFRQVIQINPEHMQGHYYLGVCYVETGKKAEARKAFLLVKEKESDPAVQASVAEYLEKLN